MLFLGEICMATIAKNILNGAKGIFNILFGFLFIGLANAGSCLIFLDSLHVPLWACILIALISSVIWGKIYYSAITTKVASDGEEDDNNNGNVTPANKQNIHFFKRVWNLIIKVFAYTNPFLVNSVGMGFAFCELANFFHLSSTLQITCFILGFIAGGVAAYHLTRKAMIANFSFTSTSNSNQADNAKNTNDLDTAKASFKHGYYFVATSLAIITSGMLTAAYTAAPNWLIATAVITLSLITFAAYYLVNKNNSRDTKQELDVAITKSAKFLALITSFAIAGFNYYAGFRAIPGITKLITGTAYSNIYLNYTLAIIGAVITLFAAAAFYLNFANKYNSSEEKTKKLIETKPYRAIAAIGLTLIMATTLVIMIYGAVKDDFKELLGAKVSELFAILIAAFSTYLCIRTFLGVCSEISSYTIVDCEVLTLAIKANPDGGDTPTAAV